jgi:hypothetical protein
MGLTRGGRVVGLGGSAKLADVEDWLYNDGFETTKTVYGEKLAELKVRCRLWRPPALTTCLRALS